MKIYKAFVKNKQTKKHLVIESDDVSKENFIFNLRRNGYAVNPNKVKEAKLFDYIMEKTNCSPWDWKETKKIG